MIDGWWVVAFLQNIGAILWTWGWLKRRLLVFVFWRCPVWVWADKWNTDTVWGFSQCTQPDVTSFLISVLIILPFAAVYFKLPALSSFITYPPFPPPKKKVRNLRDCGFRRGQLRSGIFWVFYVAQNGSFVPTFPLWRVKQVNKNPHSNAWFLKIGPVGSKTSISSTNQGA